MGGRWKKIPGFGMYEVSTTGLVRHASTKALRAQATGRLGRKQVTLRSDRGRRMSSQYVHRLVLLAFRGEPPAGHECRHLDGDAANNRLSNLRWGTRAENAADRVRHAALRSDPTIAIPRAPKVTPEIRAEILGAAASNPKHGWITELADRFDLDRKTITNVFRGQTPSSEWKARKAAPGSSDTLE
jgi:hypothetical protein